MDENETCAQSDEVVINQTKSETDGFKLQCNDQRRVIQTVKVRVRSFMEAHVFACEESYKNQHAEMKANIMLAFRHLEDARMRIGKVLQAADDGVSIYDKI